MTLFCTFSILAYRYSLTVAFRPNICSFPLLAHHICAISKPLVLELMFCISWFYRVTGTQYELCHNMDRKVGCAFREQKHTGTETAHSSYASHFSKARSLHFQFDHVSNSYSLKQGPCSFNSAVYSTPFQGVSLKSLHYNFPPSICALPMSQFSSRFHPYVNSPS